MTEVLVSSLSKFPVFWLVVPYPSARNWASKKIEVKEVYMFTTLSSKSRRIKEKDPHF